MSVVNVWADEYARVLDGKEPDTWYVVELGSGWLSYEISVCNTNDPHGFISWGWDGPNKIVVGTGNNPHRTEDEDADRAKLVWKKVLSNAAAIAAALNTDKPT